MTRCLSIGLALCLWGGVASAGPPQSSAYVTDAQGRRFRTRFEPGHRFFFGAGWSTLATGSADVVDAGMGRLGTGLRVRHLLDFPDEDVAWKMYHRILEARLFQGEAEGARPVVEATVYHGRYVRWTRDGFITIPTSPPTRLAFPLNVGAEVSVGELRTRPRSTLAAELGIVRSEVLFDFWRSKRLGSFAQVGIGPEYAIWFLDGTPGAGLQPSHVVAPFSMLSATVHHEWDSGRQVVNLRVQGAWAWSSRSDAWGARADALASYEIVFLALNDHPLSFFVDLAYRFESLELRDDDPGRHDLRTTAGLRLGWPLD